jgi:hypothetical protein
MEEYWCMLPSFSAYTVGNWPQTAKKSFMRLPDISSEEREVMELPPDPL